MVLIFFAGCNLLFKGSEISSRPLRIFGNSSSVQLVGTFARETCSASTTYYITDEINRQWVEFHSTPTFFIRIEERNRNRNRKRYNHFLEVGINTQVDYHYWKTTETLVVEENGTCMYTRKKLSSPPRMVPFDQLTNLQKNKASPAKTSVAPCSSPLWTYHVEERLRLSNRNYILMT